MSREQQKIRRTFYKSASLALALLFTGACQGDAPPAPASKEEPAKGEAASALRPAPGAKLSGPVPAPKKRVARASGAAPLDLGSDRPVVKVDVPKPPRGGAVPFVFGERRRGWVARIPEGLQLPALAYGDGKVYVSAGFESYSVYALDAEDGHIDWSTKNLEDDGPTAPIYYEDRVIFNTESCTLFVLDAQSGQRLWYKYLGDPTLAQVAAAKNLIIAAHPGSSGPEVSAYQIENGATVWTRAVDGEILVTPVIAGEVVYFATITGRLYALDLNTGKRLWSNQIHATTAPWVEGEELHITRREKGKELVVVASAKTGEILRTHTAVEAKYLRDVPRNLNSWKKVWVFEGSRPAVVGGVRYLAMGDRIEAADPETGETFWVREYKEETKRRALGSVAIAGPQVVFSTQSGQLFGLDIDTGYTLFSYDVGAKIAAEPIIANGWIYAATTKGEVIALEVADTTLDGWHMFGGNPQHNGVTERGAPSQGISKKVIGRKEEAKKYYKPMPNDIHKHPLPLPDPFLD